MRKREFRVTDPSEAAFLGEVEVRLVEAHELARCEQEVCEKHYLKKRSIGGGTTLVRRRVSRTMAGIAGMVGGGLPFEGAGELDRLE
jgi:hypothetical protein